MKPILLACAVLMAGCPSTPVPVDSAPPGPVGASYSVLCAHLAQLGCPEGKAVNCATDIGKFQDAGLGDLKPACLLSATSVTAAQACGTVACK